MQYIKNQYRVEVSRYSHGFSCYIVSYDDGTWAVNTPISMERGFNSESEAQDYASSYGRVDSRKKLKTLE